HPPPDDRVVQDRRALPPGVPGRHLRRGLRPRRRDQPQRHLLHHPCRGTAHEGERQRIDRQLRLRGRSHRPADARLLPGVQGRGGRPVQGGGGGAGPLRHPGQRAGPGRYPDRHAHRVRRRPRPGAARPPAAEATGGARGDRPDRPLPRLRRGRPLHRSDAGALRRRPHALTPHRPPDGEDPVLHTEAPHAEVALTDTPGVERRFLEILDDTIRADIGSGAYHGANVIVARHGRIALRGSYGLADTATGRPTRREDVYRILSMSKGFTNALVFRALSEGRLMLSTRVVDLVPEFFGTEPFRAARKDRINLAHLLTHRAG